MKQYPAPRPTRRSIFKGRFLFISIVFHVLLALVATYLVVQTFTPRKHTFTAPAKAANPNRAVEHQVQLAKKQKSMSAPAPTKRIVTTGLSKVVLPAMPDMPAPPTAPNTMQAPSVAGSSPGSLGMAGGPGGGGGGGLPFFGLRNAGEGLRGTFYDLKQTRAGRPSEFAIPEGKAGKYGSPEEKKLTLGFGDVVDRFIRGGFNKSVLNRYFAGPVELYATQIWIPWSESDLAPKAFDLEGKVDPRRWVVVYEGRVIPPQDGTFTLVGHADDLIAVRIDGHTVLSPGDSKVTYTYSAAKFMQAEVGTPFAVKGGVAISISIVIGEKPGGKFGAYLFIQKDDASFKKDKAGNPILPIFKFARGRDPKSDRTLPPFAKDSSWSVWKVAPYSAKSSTGLLP